MILDQVIDVVLGHGFIHTLRIGQELIPVFAVLDCSLVMSH